MSAAPPAPPRVVLDTNVVLSFWHFRHPRMLALRAYLEARRAVLVTRDDCLAELALVLAYARFAIDPARQTELLAAYRDRCLVWPAARADASALPRCRDRDDQKFLELAWEADAGLLLTRDKRVLAMGDRAPWRGRTRVVTPERLLREDPSITSVGI